MKFLSATVAILAQVVYSSNFVRQPFSYRSIVFRNAVPRCFLGCCSVRTSTRCQCHEVPLCQDIGRSGTARSHVQDRCYQLARRLSEASELLRRLLRRVLRLQDLRERARPEVQECLLPYRSLRHALWQGSRKRLLEEVLRGRAAMHHGQG